jgi:hypothetical protein
VPFNDLAKNSALTGLAAGITHIGVNTLVAAPPADGSPGTGATAAATEAAGGSPAYARLAATWAAAAVGQDANSATLLFDVGPGTYGFLTFWNAPTGNSGTQYRGYVPINGGVKGFGTVDAADLTANTITSNGHGLANNDRVIIYNVFGETIPGGVTEGAVYYVVGATTDTFQMALTSGGAAIDLVTTQGELYFQKIIPETFGAQGQISVAIGAIVLDATGI